MYNVIYNAYALHVTTNQNNLELQRFIVSILTNTMSTHLTNETGQVLHLNMNTRGLPLF